MPKIIVATAFKFAHAGIHVEEFAPGEEPVETTDECADLAIGEGWATAVPDEEKAHAGAPENKDAAPKRKTKASA